MEFGILGPLEVREADRLLSVGGYKQRALLAILLTQANKVVSTDHLLQSLWGDDAPDTADHSVQVYVSQLRKVLEPALARGSSYHVLVSQPPGYVIRLETGQLDLDRFERLLEMARAEASLGEHASAIDSFSKALALWRGPPFAEFASEPFAVGEAIRIGEMRLTALEDRFDSELLLGRHAAVVGQLQALVTEQPLRERLCCQLMLALYRSGRQAEASAVYQQTRERLVEEFGMQPGQALQTLLKRILNQDSSLQLNSRSSRVAAAGSSDPTNRRTVCPVIVGRENEIRALESALFAAKDGTGGLTLLAGDAGIGKSCLARDLSVRAREHRFTVMEGACSEAEFSMPYLPFLEAIGNYLTTAGPGELRERLGPAGRDLAQVFPQLGYKPPRDVSQSDGPQATLRLYESMLALLRLAAQPNGLLLVVEDLHWVDHSTGELLDFLARRLRTSKILIVATYRQDEIHRKHPAFAALRGWRRSGLAQLIKLEPLPPEGIASMVSAIFDEPAEDDTRDFLHARCDGNPFVLEEMLKVAIDRGDIFRTESGWTRRALSEFQLPETVRESILLRVDRMRPDETDVLRTAAVLGSSFDYSFLLSVCGREIESQLEAFVEQQLVEEEPGRHGRYRFRHALTQEAIYESMSAPKRERLHKTAARMLAGRVEVPAVDLAHHLLLANLAHEALPILDRAASEAETKRAYHEAVDLRKRALAAATDELARAQLMGKIGEALWLAHDVASALEYLEKAIEELSRLDQIAEAEHYRIVHGRAVWDHVRHDLARVDFQHAIDALTPLGPSRDLALALMWRGGIEGVNNRGDLGEPFVKRALEVAERIGADDVRIWAANYVAVTLKEAFQYEAANQVLEGAFDEAISTDLPHIAIQLLNNVMNNCFFMASPRRYGPVIRKLRSLETEIGDLIALQGEGDVSYLEGNLEAALTTRRRYLVASQQLGSPRFVTIALIDVATVLVMLGRLTEAGALISLPDPQESFQAACAWALPWCRYHLAIGDPSRAAEGALAVASNPTALVTGLPWVDAIMEALVAGGLMAAAKEVATAARASPGHRQQPQLVLATARFELASQRAEEAVALARVAVERFGSLGDNIDELTARIVLARALAACGQHAARGEVIACLRVARNFDARYLEQLALAVANTLGLDSDHGPASQ